MSDSKDSKDMIQAVLDLMGRTVRMEIRNADGGTWVRFGMVAGVQAPLNDRDVPHVIIENYRDEDHIITSRTFVGFSELADIRPAS